MTQNIRKFSLYGALGLLVVMSLLLFWQHFTKGNVQTEVARFAKDAASQFYTFDYQEDQKRLAQVKPFFNNKDWQRYRDWFFKSDQFAIVKDKHLSVSAHPVSEENILRKIDKRNWEIIVPLNVTYSDSGQLVHSTHLQVVMTVHAQPLSWKHHFVVTNIAAKTYTLS